jgi:hypothetical protein
MKKTYTIIDYPTKGQTYGDFESTTPNTAASKALTILSELNNISNKNKNYIIFTIADKNKNSNKLYTYIGTRILIENSSKNNKTRYKNVISRYKNL